MTDSSRRRTSALVAGGAGALLFGVITLLVHADPHWLRSLDHRLGAGPERFAADHAWVRHLANVVADLTLPDYVVVLVILLAAVLAMRGSGRAAVWSFIVIEVARWSYVVLKAVLERHRPTWAHPAAHLAGWSYPSGHATVIGAAAGIAIVLAVMFSPTQRARRRVVVAAVLVAGAVGFDRVLLGVHYPSDVVAGLFLGATITLLVMAAFDPVPRSSEPGPTTISP